MTDATRWVRGAEEDDLGLMRDDLRHVFAEYTFAHAAVKDDRIVGVLFGSVAEAWYSRSRVATDLVVFCEHPGLSHLLVSTFLLWADQAGVASVVMSTSSGKDIERTAAFYRAIGLEQIGTVHRRMTA